MLCLVVYILFPFVSSLCYFSPWGLNYFLLRGRLWEVFELVVGPYSSAKSCDLQLQYSDANYR